MRRYNPDVCGFEGCNKVALYRGETIVPKEKIARCIDHPGHHDFTEFDDPIDGWVPIKNGIRISTGEE